MTRIWESLAALPRRLRWLVTTVLGAGVLSVVGSLALADGVPSVPSLLIATGLMAASHAARLRIRIGSEHTGLSWGEAALVVLLCLLPPAWVALTVFAGVLPGRLLTRQEPIRALYNAAAGAIAATVASVAVLALGGIDPVPPLTFRTAVVLSVAATAYALLTTLLAAWPVAISSGSSVSTVIRRGLGVTGLMLIGNLTIGLLVVTLGLIDVRWLIILPPLLWLLHETYRARLRAAEERRTWQELAAATHELNHLNERQVARSALRGLCRLFSPDAVEVTVHRLERTFVGTSTGELVDTSSDSSDSAPTPRDDAGFMVVRSLEAGGEKVGELRLWFREPVRLGEREELALSAFADALGAALQNAATHTTLQALAHRKSYEASHDPLTGLANRVRLLEYGDSALRALADSGRSASAALLLLDLDHFKEVNDTLGHAAGDDLLRVLAAKLAAATEPGEMLARLGGDEFALLITAVPETASAVEHAACRGRQLATELALPIEVAGLSLSVETSIGVVVVPAGSCDITELLRRADVAMYQAKRSGRTLVVYDGSKDGASTDRLALLAELREALNTDDQLMLVLQPAVDLVTGAPVGAEALVRWNHPRRGLLPPAEFIGVVEHSELIGPFTRYVIDVALGHVARWLADGLDIPIAVNLSARSLLDRHLPTDIAQLLERHQVPPDRLVLEITETVMMTELDIIDDVLTALRQIGVQLAVDDFGTGYSSLTFLTRFPVDEVKVDRAFVTRMLESPEAAAIVRTTVELARTLGLRIVAEGVETAEQLAALEDMGCTAAQGYHFFAPLPADRVDQVLWRLQERAMARGAQVIPLARGAHAGRRPESS